MLSTILSILLVIVLALCVWLFLQQKNMATELFKFKDIKDVDEYIKSEKKRLEEIKSKLENEQNQSKTTIANLASVIQSLNKEITGKKEDLQAINETLDIAEFGVYQPIFNFDDPEIYKTKIKEIKEKQKQIIKAGEAIVGGEHWTLEGSQAKGQQMVDKHKKLMLRAFNGESDTFISKVSYSNVENMINRIDKLFDQVNQLGARLNTEITFEYLECKKTELRLVHEQKEKLHQLKEEQKAIKEQIREEQKVEEERQKAIKEAEKEEKIQQEALEKAREQLERASKEQQDFFLVQIKELEEALEATKRKKSQAELTKSGHVYIISNLGSFGDEVYKIGMTRRLEPMERIKELSNASVPFDYDIHAMIATNNAPELENKLHKHFEEKRINKVNKKREFFRTSLDDIEKAVIEITGKETDFVKTHTAREYKESLSIKAASSK